MQRRGGGPGKSAEEHAADAMSSHPPVSHASTAAQLPDIEAKEKDQETSLHALLMEVLGALNREDSLQDTLRYLGTEWFHTEQDLYLASQDLAVWDALRLPARLKLALKAGLVRNYEGRRKQSAAAALPPAPGNPVAAGAGATTADDTATRAGAGQLKVDVALLLPPPPNAITGAEAEAGAGAEAEAWVRCYSPEHRSFYFFHAASQRSCWDAPEGIDCSKVRCC